MKVVSDSLGFSTRGFNDIKDITREVSRSLARCGLKNGILTIFIPGSTAGLTTIEYEPGLVRDFSEAMERIIPSQISFFFDDVMQRLFFFSSPFFIFLLFRSFNHLLSVFLTKPLSSPQR